MSVCGVVLRRRVDDGRVLGRQVAVERLLVERARLAVHADQERLEAHRLDVLAGSARPRTRRSCPPGRGLHHLLELDGAVEDGVQLLGLVADPLGLAQVEELPVQRLPVHAQVGGGQGVVERHGRAVVDGLGDGVLVQVALRVVHAEDLEGALAAGRAGRSGVPVKPM